MVNDPFTLVESTQKLTTLFGEGIDVSHLEVEDWHDAVELAPERSIVGCCFGLGRLRQFSLKL